MSIWLVMKTADGGERPFLLLKERTVIGRATRSDLRVPIPSVSSTHCEIILRGNEARLLDLGSEGGTLHNGQLTKEAVLRDSDHVTVGPVTFEFRVRDDDGQDTRAVADRF